MASLNFTFRKKRDIGLLVGDFFDLFKLIFKQFHAVILGLIWPMLIVSMILGYYLTDYLVGISKSSQFDEYETLALAFILLMGVMFIFYFFISMFASEYFYILNKKKNLGFGVKDVWESTMNHFSKHIKFALTAIPITGVALVVFIFIYLFVSLIPILGIILSFFISALLYVFYAYMYSVLFLYIEGRGKLKACYSEGLNLITEKFKEYAIASFLFSFILSFISMLLTVLPALIIFLISFVLLRETFNPEEFFDSTLGKSLIAIGISLMTLVNILSWIYFIGFYNLIYQSALQEIYQEETLDELDLIGTLKDDF